MSQKQYPSKKQPRKAKGRGRIDLKRLNPDDAELLKITGEHISKYSVEQYLKSLNEVKPATNEEILETMKGIKEMERRKEQEAKEKHPESDVKEEITIGDEKQQSTDSRISNEKSNIGSIVDNPVYNAIATVRGLPLMKGESFDKYFKEAESLCDNWKEMSASAKIDIIALLFSIAEQAEMRREISDSDEHTLTLTTRTFRPLPFFMKHWEITIFINGKQEHRFDIPVSEMTGKKRDVKINEITGKVFEVLRTHDLPANFQI